MSEYEQIIDQIKTNEKTKKDLDEKHEVSKKQLVLKAKDVLLKENFKIENIAKKIVDDLKGYVNQSYIRSLLESEFKNQSKATRVPQIMNADGSLAAEAESQSNTNESKEEKQKRLRQEYEENKYYSGAKNANKNIGGSMSASTTVSESDNTTSSGKLFIPSNKILPEDQAVVSHDNKTGEIVKSEQIAIEIDADILDQIVILRSQNNVTKAKLIIDAKTFEVITVQASK